MRYITISLSMVLTLFAAGASVPAYHLVSTVAIGKPGTWDYVLIDDALRRAYISHETEVEILNLDTKQTIGQISDTAGVHGIAIASEFGRGFVSEGKADRVLIFDLRTLRTIGEVPTEKKPDCIIYDPASKLIFAMNGESNSSTVIDPSSGKVKATLNLGGGPEFSVADGKGSIYVNLQEQNQLIRIDTHSLRVKDRWPTAPCSLPTSLALDGTSHRLFVGCRSKVFAVINADTGKVIATYPIGERVDATAFDSATGLVFNATGDGRVSVFKQLSPDKYSLVQIIETSLGSKTMGLDLRTHQLIIPGKPSGIFTVMFYGQ